MPQNHRHRASLSTCSRDAKDTVREGSAMDATSVAQEPQRVEKAKVRVKASCYRKRQGRDGKEEFNEVTLPKGLLVEGATNDEGRELGTVDVGRHKLYPRYVTMERDEELGGEVASMTYTPTSSSTRRSFPGRAMPTWSRPSRRSPSRRPRHT